MAAAPRKIYECEHCTSYKCRNKKDLALHMLREHNIKPKEPLYPCKSCGVDFGNKSAKDRHKCPRHEPKNNEQVYCSNCGKWKWARNFRARCQVRGHVEGHISEIQPELAESASKKQTHRQPQPPQQQQQQQQWTGPFPAFQPNLASFSQQSVGGCSLAQTYYVGQQFPAAAGLQAQQALPPLPVRSQAYIAAPQMQPVQPVGGPAGRYTACPAAGSPLGDNFYMPAQMQPMDGYPRGGDSGYVSRGSASWSSPGSSRLELETELRLQVNFDQNWTPDL